MRQEHVIDAIPPAVEVVVQVRRQRGEDGRRRLKDKKKKKIYERGAIPTLWIYLVTLIVSALASGGASVTEAAVTLKL